MNILNPYLNEFQKEYKSMDFRTYLQKEKLMEEFNKKFDPNVIVTNYRLREKWTKQYAWAIPNQQAIDTIVKYHNEYKSTNEYKIFPFHFDGMIEICAGTGYWANMIEQHPQFKHDIVCYDINDNPKYKYHEIEYGSYEQLNKQCNMKRMLFICWPPYGNSGNELLESCLEIYENDLFIYVGENDGCTAWSDKLDDEWEEIDFVNIPQYDSLHDRLMVFQRKM